jgi:hypothetical protein
MRTTLDIDDAVLAAARALAAQERMSLGAAVSRLAQRGLVAGTELKVVKGFPTFSSEPGATPITLETVNAHRDG